MSKPVQPPISPAEAGHLVRGGSDIVVIPYTAYMQPDQKVRLSTYTEMTARAAAALFHEAAAEDTQVIAIGEHTYGQDYPSTTDLIYTDLRRHGVPHSACAAERPQHADTTPQQLAWLATAYGTIWHGRAPVLVGHAQHWRRIAQLCRVYGISAEFVDAATVLEASRKLTPAYRHAMRVYESENGPYEQKVQRLTTLTAWLGPAALTAIFRALVRLRSPNVVEVGGLLHGGSGLYTATARQHTRDIRKHTP